MKLNVFILSIFVSIAAIAQPITFKRTFGAGNGFNEGHGVVQLPDSGFIITGSASGIGSGASDVLLIRTDKNGIQQWIKSIGWLNVDVARNIQPANDGNYVICGYTNSLGNGGYDALVIKINEDGDTLWTKTYGGADWDFGYDINPTADGGFIIAGETYTNTRGYNDFYIAKIDNNGSLQWQKNYGTDTVDAAYRAIETFTGDILVIGNSVGYSANQLNDGVVMRLNAVGDSVKSLIFSTTADETIYGITQTPDTGYFVCGTSRPTNSAVNSFMEFKADKNDNLLNTYIINNGYYTTLRAIIALTATNVVVAGYSHPPGDNKLFSLVQKFNNGDGYVWGCDINLLDKEEEFRNVIKTNDGGFCAVGTVKEVSPGLTSASLMKIGPDGEQSSGVVLSVKNTPVFNFNIYPNPTDGNFNITFKQNVKSLDIKVYNAIGQQVFNKAYKNATSITEDFNQFENGLYFIQLSADGALGTQRLVIAK